MTSRRGSYEELAFEYYDPGRHPTCFNFRAASGEIIENCLNRFLIPAGWSCDVGAGKSVLAEILTRREATISRLLLVDSSMSMLMYSKQWCSLGARALCGDVTHLPLRPGSIALLVSSLGDPYNNEEFWAETARVTCGEGIVIFTTPSHEWAKAYRDAAGEELCVSRFIIGDSDEIDVPSLIYPRERQIELIQANGFTVKEVVEAPLSSLQDTTISPKLSRVCSAKTSIVTGYFAVRQ